MLQNEKPFLALLSANGILASIHKFFVGHQPEFTSFLTMLQIIIALMTILHFSRKYIKYLLKSAKDARTTIVHAEEQAKRVLKEAATAAKHQLENEKELQ